MTSETCPWCDAAEGECGHHATFLAQLRIGYEQAWLVAERLAEMRLPVRITPMEVRRDLADRGRFRDEIDLTVGARLIDVKSSSRRWMCAAEIPFDPVYVDTVRGWDRKGHKPAAVVLVSQPTGAMVVVPGSTEAEWVVLNTFDTVRGFAEERYACPKRLLRSIEALGAWLREHR